MRCPWYKRWHNWVLFVVAAMLVGLGLSIWSSHAEFSARVAKLQAAGIPTNPAELNDFYRVPEGVQDTTELWVAALDSVDEAAIKEVQGSLPYIGTVEPPQANSEWPGFEQAQAFLVSQSDTMNAIREAMMVGGAVRFDVDFSPGVDTQLPRTSECRNLMRLLSLDCQVAYREEDNDRVHSNLLGMLRLSGILQAEPTMISQLVGNAQYSVAYSQTAEYVELCEWSDEQLMQLQELVAEPDFRTAFRTGLMGEQVSVLFFLGQAPSIATFGGASKLRALRYFEEFFATKDIPWNECIEKQGEITSRFRDTPGFLSQLGLNFAGQLLPALDLFSRSMARMEAQRQCLTGVLAMARLRVCGIGLPDVLADIPETALIQSDVPLDWTDPFDGQPLRYLYTEDTLTVYSIGEDQEDNAGQLEQSPQSIGYDVGFQLKWKSAGSH